jgi:hypothetical protein
MMVFMEKIEPPPPLVPLTDDEQLRLRLENRVSISEPPDELHLQRTIDSLEKERERVAERVASGWNLTLGARV